MATSTERPATRSRGASLLGAPNTQVPPRVGGGGSSEENRGIYDTGVGDSRRGSGAPGSLPGALAKAAESTKLQGNPAKEGPGVAENRPAEVR